MGANKWFTIGCSGSTGTTDKTEARTVGSVVTEFVIPNVETSSTTIPSIPMDYTYPVGNTEYYVEMYLGNYASDSFTLKAGSYVRRVIKKIYLV